MFLSLKGLKKHPEIIIVVGRCLRCRCKWDRLTCTASTITPRWLKICALLAVDCWWLNACGSWDSAAELAQMVAELFATQLEQVVLSCCQQKELQDWIMCGIQRIVNLVALIQSWLKLPPLPPAFPEGVGVLGDCFSACAGLQDANRQNAACCCTYPHSLCGSGAYTPVDPTRRMSAQPLVNHKWLGGWLLGLIWAMWVCGGALPVM